MIAWMQAWSNSKFVPDGVKYFGQMTVPRELTLKDNRLIQKPVRELEAYRSGRICHEKVKITEETSLEGVSGRVIDMTVKLKADDNFREFSMKVAQNEDYYTSVFMISAGRYFVWTEVIAAICMILCTDVRFLWNRWTV